MAVYIFVDIANRLCIGDYCGCLARAAIESRIVSGGKILAQVRLFGKLCELLIIAIKVGVYATNRYLHIEAKVTI